MWSGALAWQMQMTPLPLCGLSLPRRQWNDETTSVPHAPPWSPTPGLRRQRRVTIADSEGDWKSAKDKYRAFRLLNKPGPRDRADHPRDVSTTATPTSEPWLASSLPLLFLLLSSPSIKVTCLCVYDHYTTELFGELVITRISTN